MAAPDGAADCAVAARRVAAQWVQCGAFRPTTRFWALPVHAGAPNVIAAYAEYGGFNPHFLGCNLFVSLFNPPLINGNAPAVLSDACDHLLAGVDFDTVATTAFEPNPIGMSIFLVTPACFLLLAALRRTPLTIAAWVGLLATMIPLWLYHNTGSSQFGYRYWFDAAPFWLLLLAENDPTDP